MDVIAVDGAHIEECDYQAILQIRLTAYRAAGLVSLSATAQEMADEWDPHSIHLVARLDRVVVGAARLIYCEADADRFMFEKDIPFSAIRQGARRDFLEVSRLAVAPPFQRSYVFSALATGAAREIIRRGYQHALCLARTAQRACYSKCGFRTASNEIPHPRLSGQSLALMRWDADGFLSGAAVAPGVQKRIVRRVLLD